MRLIRVWLVERSKSDSFILDDLGCNNVIAKKKLTSNDAMPAFGTESTKDLANRKFKLLE